MRPADLVRLVVLAALWGGSFMLVRVVAPALGTIVTAESRVAIASIALVAWCFATGVPLALRAHAWPMTVVGLFNSALPFALFAFAVRTVPASYAAIINATSPLFGALIARAWFGEALGMRRVLGVLCGIAGVAVLVRFGPIEGGREVVVACMACLAAALSYGFAGNYSRRHAGVVPPTAMATGSQIAGAIWLAPLIPFDPLHALPTGPIVAAAVALGLASTAAAYVLYFRLIHDVGATRALTVTFLIPLFAVGLGWAWLGEAVTWRMGAGGALVLVATWLVVSATNASPRGRPVRVGRDDARRA